MERIENVMHGAKHSYTEIPKFFSDVLRTIGRNFQSILQYIYATLNIMKLTYVIQMHKSMFSIKKMT